MQHYRLDLNRYELLLIKHTLSDRVTVMQESIASEVYNLQANLMAMSIHELSQVLSKITSLYATALVDAG